MDTHSLSFDPMSNLIRDQILERILRHLDPISLMVCRQVSRQWQRRVDICGPWLQLVRRQGLFDCGNGVKLSAQRARHLLFMSKLSYSEMPTVELAGKNDLDEFDFKDLELLYRPAYCRPDGLGPEFWMLDHRRPCLIKRFLSIEGMVMEDNGHLVINRPTPGFIALAFPDENHDSMCRVLPLDPGPHLIENAVKVVAFVHMPKVIALHGSTLYATASFRCPCCNKNCLLYLGCSGNFQLWSLPEVSLGDKPAVLFEPLDSEILPLGNNEESLLIEQVAAPTNATYSVFAIMNSNDANTKTTVTFVRVDCHAIHLIRGRISLGGDEVGFLRATDGVLVTMVAAKGPLPQKRWLRVTRFNLVENRNGIAIRQDKFMYCIPNELLTSQGSFRLIGYGAKLFCVEVGCTSIMIYQVKRSHPVCVLNLPEKDLIDRLLPVSDWLDRGLDPTAESCPLLASVPMDDKDAISLGLVSWQSASVQPVCFKAKGFELN